MQCETKFVRALQQYTIQIWKGRKEVIHGKNLKENKHIRLQKFRDEVENLYARPDRRYIPKTADNLSKRPREQRLTQGITTLKTWTKLTEQRMNMHREQAAKIKIHRWIKYKETTQHKESVPERNQQSSA